MPPRKSSASRTEAPRSMDDVLLEERICANKIDLPIQGLAAIAFFASFQPVYLAHAVYNVEIMALPNIVLYLIVIGATTWMLLKAYTIMVESEFWKRQHHYDEVKGTSDAKLLRKLRLQVAMGYALFFVNTLFFALSTLLHVYIFRNSDPRAALILSPTLVSSFLWLIAHKNEESRQRRLVRHK